VARGFQGGAVARRQLRLGVKQGAIDVDSQQTDSRAGQARILPWGPAQPVTDD
jgi:hypothetical protein